MSNIFRAAVLLLSGLVASTSAHDLLLKLDSYFLQPHSKATVRLMNGTFQTSEAVVARDRLTDTRVVAPNDKTLRPLPEDFRDEGQTTLLEMETAGPGTYVIGLSTKPRGNSLKAADFNEYLEHEGIPDILSARAKSGDLGKDARYEYSKYVKAVVQVGETRTDTFKAKLNYPVELVPQQNPYSLKVGQSIGVQCLMAGRPLPNQLVVIGCEAKGEAAPEIRMRADASGVARFELKQPGKWYVKIIHMSPVKSAGLDYESKWATVTFEIR